MPKRGVVSFLWTLNCQVALSDSGDVLDDPGVALLLMGTVGSRCLHFEDVQSFEVGVLFGALFGPMEFPVDKPRLQQHANPQ